MSTRPKNQDASVFDKSIRGFYGEFRSDTSYPLSFLQTVVPIDDIGLLKTATEVFSSHTLDFEEIIQRDIDQKRVKEIVDVYLTKGKDRVLFFPPLLVSLVAIDNETLVPLYEGVEHISEEDNEIHSVWGKDRFKIIMPYNTTATGYTYTFDEKVVDSTPYWSILEINTKKVAMIVIDGQHRLSALKTLWSSRDEQNKSIVKDMSIPITVLYSPNATTGKNETETISRDLRELFVRINTTAKEVSGHFITLLNDRSLSSFATRSFCDLCKTDIFDEDLDHLNLIEWNQRESKLSSQVNRKYSITTINIIADTLAKYAFDCKSGVTKTILNLEAYKTELEKDNDKTIDDISEDTFSASQGDMLRSIINEKISISLKILYFEPRPYKEMVESFLSAKSKLQEEIDKGIKGRSHFKKNILGLYRDTNDFDSEASKETEQSFIDDIKYDSGDRVYLSNVFQQALIRSWLKMSTLLTTYNLSPVDVASSLIPMMDSLCFKKEKRLFDNERMYLQKLIFNGTRYIVTNKAKDNWCRLIMATLLNENTRSAFIKCLTEINNEINEEEINEKLIDHAKANLKEYIEVLSDVIHNDYMKTWRDKELPTQTLQELEELSEKILAGDENAEDDFNSKISEFSKARTHEAKDKLSGVLEI